MSANYLEVFSMGRVWIPKPLFVVVVAVVLPLVTAMGAAAQDSAPPGLGSGWELQLERPMESVVAGNADVGFLVWGFEGIGPDAAEVVALWSADGSEWREVTDETGQRSVFDVVANDRGFVGVDGSRLPNNTVLFSADGRTWETASVAASADYWRAESGPGGFLVVSGCDFVVSFAPDGRAWQTADLPAECGSFRAAPTNNGWVAVTNRDNAVVVLSSVDGVTWSEVEAQAPLPPLPPPTSWLGFEESLRNVSLSSDGETLVLAGKGLGGALWVSTDEGVTWTETGTVSGEVEMTVSDFGFVGVAPQRVVVSSDGITWVEHRVDVDFDDVAAAGNTIVATAADGIYTWTLPVGTLPHTGPGRVVLTFVASGTFFAIGGAVLLLRRRLDSPGPPAFAWHPGRFDDLDLLRSLVDPASGGGQPPRRHG